MTMTEQTFTVRVHAEPGELLWAEVIELPGCFASGETPEELMEALTEAIGMCLPDPQPVRVTAVEGQVTEQRVLVTTAA
jgi:predicted RNase H-like HicB family nuclease